MKPFNRLKNYLENYTRTEHFIQNVLKLREEMGLPKDGLPLPSNMTQELLNSVADSLGITYSGKRHLTSPKFRSEAYGEILKQIPKIYDGFELTSFINIFIAFNIRRYEEFRGLNFDITNTVNLIELRREYKDLEGLCDCSLKASENYLDYESKKYPMAIGISPYATQNEVIAVIKEQWGYIQFMFEMLEKNKSILPFQEERETLKRVRSRSDESKELEDFVFKHKRFSLKELAKKIQEKFNKFLDEGEVGKLRSLAVKRRISKRK